jgi:hypothetical protein
LRTLTFALEMALEEEKETGNVFEKRSLKRSKALLKRLKGVSDKIGASPRARTSKPTGYG